MPFIMMVRNFGSNTFRSIMLAIDWAVYNLLSFLTQIIFDIADLPADTFKDIYDGILSKIYIILALFMLFKILVSLLTYLVNPDVMSDKQQGLGKLVTRILITFVLLIGAPTIFNLMIEAQGPILRTLPKIILNGAAYDGTGTKNNITDSLANDGTTISWSVLKTFIYRNPECVGESSPTAYAEPDYKEWIKNYEVEGINKEGLPPNILTLMTEHINDHCGNDGSMYAYSYTPFISTIAGGFLCFVLIGIAVQVGARMFKLILLQALAPIPIISYIDPKSQKEGSFNNWLKMLFSTWLELFINVAIVYIIIYLISKVIIGESGSNFVNYFSKLPAPRGAFFLTFVIIGLFSFAKQAPKYIMDIIGIKNSGGFGKALGISAATFGAVGAAGGALGQNVKRTASEMGQAKNFGQGALAFAKGLGRAPGNIMSGFGSAVAGSSAAYNSDKGAMKAAMDARNKYMNNVANGKNVFTDAKDGWDRYWGHDIDREIAQASSIEATASKLRGYVNAEGAKKFSNLPHEYEWTDEKGQDQKFVMSRNQLKQGIANAINNDGRVIVEDAYGNKRDLGAADGSIIGKLSGDADDFVGDVYQDEVDSGKIKDSAGALGVLRKSYANSLGTSEAVAKQHRSKEIKKNEKSNATKAFTLKQKKGGK